MTHGSRKKKSIWKLPMFKGYKNILPKTNRVSMKNVKNRQENGTFEATGFFGLKFKKKHKRKNKQFFEEKKQLTFSCLSSK